VPWCGRRRARRGLWTARRRTWIFSRADISSPEVSRLKMPSIEASAE